MPTLQEDSDGLTEQEWPVEDRQWLLEAWTQQADEPPPSPAWRWCEQNIELDHTSPMPGPYRTDLTPFVRTVMNYAQSRTVKELDVMCSAQSAKTQTVMNFVAWLIKHAPGPMWWVMAALDEAKEFSKTRLVPLLESIDALQYLMPKNRMDKTTLLLQFPTMTLGFRGSNSRSKLQSTPVRWLILDEVRNYRPGSLELVLKRIRAFWNHLVMMISTPGNANDAFHIAWKNGSQTHIHFRCPKCKHSQPLRFGRKADPIWPLDRDKGGMRWDENETTKPNGVWNYDEAAKTVRYECESCGAAFKEQDRGRLAETYHDVDYNPAAKASHKSVHWSALYVPWIKWADLVQEFLIADAAWRRGNIEPLRAFLNESLGIPWEIRGERPKESELRKQCGLPNGEPYNRGMLWATEEQTAQVLTVDVQAAQGGHLKYVLRQWKPSGDSRLIDWGILVSFDDLYKYAVDHCIPANCVFVDSGYRATLVYKACVDYGWTALKGDNREFFTHVINRVPQRFPFRVTMVDPAIGTSLQGRVQIPLIIWSNPSYKDRLLLHIAVGRGPAWLLPDDVSNNYLDELAGEERTAKTDPRGVVSYEWVKTGPNDYLDCELEQLVVADLGGIAVAGSQIPQG